jgi:hypothetical protein
MIILGCLSLIWATWFVNVSLYALFIEKSEASVILGGTWGLFGGVFSLFLSVIAISNPPLSLFPCSEGMRVAALPYVLGSTLTLLNLMCKTDWKKVIQFIGRIY